MEKEHLNERLHNLQHQVDAELHSYGKVSEELQDKIRQYDCNLYGTVVVDTYLLSSDEREALHFTLRDFSATSPKIENLLDVPHLQAWVDRELDFAYMSDEDDSVTRAMRNIYSELSENKCELWGYAVVSPQRFSEDMQNRLVDAVKSLVKEHDSSKLAALPSSAPEVKVGYFKKLNTSGYVKEHLSNLPTSPFHALGTSKMVVTESQLSELRKHGIYMQVARKNGVTVIRFENSSKHQIKNILTQLQNKTKNIKKT